MRSPDSLRASRPGPSRFGLNGATTGDADLLTDVRVAGEAGFRYVEIRDTKLEAYLEGGGTLRQLRRAIDAAGVEALSLNALERGTLVRGAARAPVLRRCALLCEWAEALGAPYVVVVASPLADAQGPLTVVPTTVEMLRAMAETAERHGVRVGFEFLGFVWCSVTTLGAAREIVAAAGDPRIGVVLDAFHFYAGGSTWEMLEGMPADRLFIVHLDDAEDRPPGALADAHRLLPGEGVIPLRDLIHRIEMLGYSGAYSVELFRPEYWRWDPLRLARAARRSLDDLFADPSPGAGRTTHTGPAAHGGAVTHGGPPPPRRKRGRRQ